MCNFRFDLDSSIKSGPDAVYVSVSLNKHKLLFEMAPGKFIFFKVTFVDCLLFSYITIINTIFSVILNINFVSDSNILF